LGEDGFSVPGAIRTNERDADVVDALIALGYAERDAAAAVQQLSSEIVGTNARIKAALQYISG
jgi:Holliday junction resolvasome RuvABC DNA-binding subunit